MVEVDEGKMYDELLRLEAQDPDCSSKYSDICKYEILNDDQPFNVSDDGKIQNTEVLDYRNSHNYILSVVAYDCGMKRSKPALVTVKVNRVCHVGWRDAPDVVDYLYHKKALVLFPKMKFDICSIQCAIQDIIVKAKLLTSHMGQGCDRNTYSVQNQHANKNSYDLLGASTDLLSHVPVHTGQHNAKHTFSFDGFNDGIIIPSEIMPHYFGTKFTLSFWLQHSSSSNPDPSHKEHIICLADSQDMNRHHVALFVRNCRLILLLRKEHNEMPENHLSPAEWRWKLPSVCDNHWHHYGLNIDFPKVQLYVDGIMWEKDPQIIDDWPLHQSKIVNTTLTVGACWHGADNKMDHFLHGAMTALSVLLEDNEKSDVFHCLYQCQEHLQPPSPEKLEPGIEMQSAGDDHLISFRGKNLSAIEKSLQALSYVNFHNTPTPGRRLLRLSTSLMCKHHRRLAVPNIETFIDVLPTAPIIINIFGTSNINYDYESLRHGVHIFSDVYIQHSGSNKDEKHLDSCSVAFKPPFIADFEYVTLPDNLLMDLSIQTQLTYENLLLTGVNDVLSYEKVLHQLRYVNIHPKHFVAREFHLLCTDEDGSIESNEFQQILAIQNPIKPQKHFTPIPANLVKHHQIIPQPKVIHVQNNVPQTSTYDSTLVIIVALSVAFLLMLTLLGVVRLRQARRRAQQEDLADQELAWDDSALNITINPMEKFQEKSIIHDGFDDDCESEPYESEEDDDENIYRPVQA